MSSKQSATNRKLGSLDRMISVAEAAWALSEFI
jgi:hypothetical protein